MTKRNIIIIVIVALTIFNLSALATIFFTQFYSKEEPQVQKEMEEEAQPEDGIDLPKGRYAIWFREQLQLNDDQFEVFREANREYHHKGEVILEELNITRTAIINELGRKAPDEGELKYLSQRIGELHIQLKELTINYYLAMKEVCNEEQRTRLYEIFKYMTDSEGNAAIPNRKVSEDGL